MKPKVNEANILECHGWKLTKKTGQKTVQLPTHAIWPHGTIAMVFFSCEVVAVFGTASCYTTIINISMYWFRRRQIIHDIILNSLFGLISLLRQLYFKVIFSFAHTKWLTQHTQMSSMEAGVFRLECSGWIELSWRWTVYHVSHHCFTYFHPMPPSSSRTIIQVSLHHWDRLPAAETYPALAIRILPNFKKCSMNGPMLDWESKVPWK